MSHNAEKTIATIARIKANPGDHRLWKKLLRLSAESNRYCIANFGATSKTDPCMTTAADQAARLCARRYVRLNGKSGS